ncbi:MAG: DUF4417 domain-containing protein [Synergistaceae bacterium]|nr:DUF4417 domain-containing protein [Synergistaceae bacterium]
MASKKGTKEGTGIIGKVCMMPVDGLKGYERNPRKNAGAVRAVAASIRDFGFKVPIVVERDGTIIAGHTRLLAAKQLGLAEVPVVVADDLSPTEAQAFRIADNKTAELAEWDMGLLKMELAELDLADVDMRLYGFDDVELAVLLDEDDGPSSDEGDDEDDMTGSYVSDEKERTFSTFNIDAWDEGRCSGWYQMPTLEACHFVPDDLVRFNYIKDIVAKGRTEEYSKGVHFYTDDYLFERIWREPEPHIERIKRFSCALTPDFSLYMDYPMALKIWNVYRSRLIGQMMQDAGIKVIPTLQWAEPETFEFCFDGIEPGGVVAISTVGTAINEEGKPVWRAGVEAALERLRAEAVVVFGARCDYEFGDVPVVRIKPDRGFGR